MRSLAILTMVIAWMFYGAMPALANCPICDSITAMPAASPMSMHGMADMPGMASHGDMAQHQEKKPENPCAGGMAHVASCAACLALTPTLAIEDATNAFSYPAPAPGQRLADSRPQPTPPPPRFA
ncbi:hypothetical protein HGP16_15485 [Rhizobium sp. P40RR-XXII]|uniref:hypothetical protein n=1 Tax=unclassified Rhizobium TaxID=2613769 RepID=UPI0014574D77|nr:MULTISPECIES: hypothetical protein [unclassified Rhizobium]NLR87015.1 hypothetical protein [Rhizobium sp. P28RR-XV]NLS17964.1 hypothetical protein [Rhizobium sp. P40RR-XXII]